MKRILLAAVALGLAGAVAYADKHDEREAFMKSLGKSMGELGAVAKGEKPFDANEVKASLATLNETTQKFDVAALFPKGSESKGTSPKIWEDEAGFAAKVDKFKMDVAAAAGAPAADVAALQAQMGAIGGNCGGCHETFRLKTD